MSGNITRLVKDTTIYGVSSILARTLNFLLLPIYTRKLGEGDFGIYSDIFAYIAVLQVVLVFGMETGFFRFASSSYRDPGKVFSTISSFLLFLSITFFTLITLFSGNIARAMGYYPHAVIYAGGILALDSYTSVLFARLRYERKAMRFAVFRTIKILSELGFNLLFIYLLPRYFTSHPQSVLLKFFTPEVSYIYILAAVLCSCMVSVVLFIPEILKTPLKIARNYLGSILLYSFPLMLSGLQGVLNDFIDRILFRFLAPETGMAWNEQLGLFSANARLAVIMALFVQMFRYAAEPFFFASSGKQDIKPMYAQVMKYFTCFCVVIFLFVTLYSDLFQYILGKGFRSGMVILPIMLMAQLLSGINQNLSMWYKLSSQTKMALLVTFAGLLTTVTVNLLFMPRYGYMAAAWGHPASYMVMVVVSWQLSKRYYKIPYQWNLIIMYITAGLALFFVSRFIETPYTVLNLGLNTILLFAFIAFVIRRERIDVKAVAAKIQAKIR